MIGDKIKVRVSGFDYIFYLKVEVLDEAEAIKPLFEGKCSNGHELIPFFSYDNQVNPEW